MTRYVIVAEIECDNLTQAQIIAGERLGYDEQYDDTDGNPFDYRITSYETHEVQEEYPS